MTKKITKEHYDVFVIGSGTAGRKVATTAAKAGKRVAIADRREFGGTCPNRGCDPKKVLANTSELIARTTDLAKKGIVSPVEFNWKQLQAFKKEFTSAIPATTETHLLALDIKLYHQSPYFLDKDTLSVEGKTVTADRIVIATGRTPRPLHFKGAQFMITSDEFLELEELPDSMIFVGGGYIAMEFAHMVARCGVEVTIIERNQRILSTFDEDLALKLQEASSDIGINFVFNAEVAKAEKLQKNTRVYYTQNGQEKELKAEVIINASGRVPSILELDLETGGVTYSDRGVEVDKYLQNPGNSKVYACGDVADSGNLPLTPLSGIEGDTVVHNILNDKKKLNKCPVIPSVVFTQPQLATVGLTEAQAKQQNIEVSIQKNDVPQWYNAKRINAATYSYKTLVDTDGIIVGAQLLAPHAAESINLFSLAIVQKMKLRDFQKVIYTYPSWASDLQSMF